MNRDVFLARVRATLGPKGGSAAADLPGVPDWDRRADRVRADAVRRWEELLARFTEELVAVGGTAHRALPSTVGAVVSGIAKERQLSRVVAWSEAALGLPGLLAELHREGLEVGDGSPAVDRATRWEADEDCRFQISRAEIGLTGVEYGVAESGTLILLSGPGKGRLVSCLPMVHVAILRRGQLVATLDEVGVLFEALHRHSPPENFPSNIAFISGPSRTADIEMSLTRGVHGPKEVHVIALT
jgi:L-lactate dehydrogenase complex protein LldG